MIIRKGCFILVSCHVVTAYCFFWLNVKKSLKNSLSFEFLYCLYISLRLFFFYLQCYFLFIQKFLNKYLMLISHSLFIIFDFDCHYNRFVTSIHFTLFLWTLILNNFEEVIDLNRIQKSRTSKLLSIWRDFEFKALEHNNLTKLTF